MGKGKGKKGGGGGGRRPHRHHRGGGGRLPPPMRPSYPGSWGPWGGNWHWPWWRGGYPRWWYRPSWYNLSPYYAPFWALDSTPVVKRYYYQRPAVNQAAEWGPIILGVVAIMAIAYFFIVLFK